MDSADDRQWALLPQEIERAAADSGDQPFLTMGGQTYTFAEAAAQARAAAAGLTRLGVRPGDRVVILSANRAEAVWAWWGALIAGAVDVPLNAESQGRQLAYFVQDCAPRVLIGTSDLLSKIDLEAGSRPEAVVVLDAAQPGEILGQGPRYLSWDSLVAAGDLPAPVARRRGDLASIVYTSGTTGPSKGVMWPHGYYPSMTRQYSEWAQIGRGVSIYCAQPLYHLDSRSTVTMALYLRGRTTLATRFSASTFWDQIAAADADVFVFIGTMLQVLARQPASRPPGSPRLLGLGTAIPASLQAELEERFAVELLEGYGSTEVPLITACRRGAAVNGSIGTPAELVEVQLVDDHGAPAPIGHTGILLVRPTLSDSMTIGYWNKPQATADAFTDGWFNTGDLLRLRADGVYEYVGRKKDSIRRRGENVSAWEVEQAALAHPGVVESAAIGIPSEVGDEDVALLVVARPGFAVEPEQLVDLMSRDLPRFALPRYVELVDDLPKTPSERVNKAAVAERGITEAAVDLQPPR